MYFILKITSFLLSSKYTLIYCIEIITILLLKVKQNCQESNYFLCITNSNGSIDIFYLRIFSKSICQNNRTLIRLYFSIFYMEAKKNTRPSTNTIDEEWEELFFFFLYRNKSISNHSLCKCVKKNNIHILTSFRICRSYALENLFYYILY
jgi:hypothetical protein